MTRTAEMAENVRWAARCVAGCTEIPFRLAGHLREAADHMESLARERDRAVEALAEPKWQSVDRDNMEFAARITCWQMDRIRAFLADIDTESEGEAAPTTDGRK